MNLAHVFTAGEGIFFFFFVLCIKRSQLGLSRVSIIWPQQIDKNVSNLKNIPPHITCVFSKGIS